ncbi:MAG TPA: 23S rRNA (uracil(1939)-C(5))-methyltransferase RlmD [Herpetosiphonaceae bacterium]|nr:23S rRNA (uracil(1939)-C(5))-methyltransferase RlmD [Herpetosiphonaceae bacterium]
MMAQPWPDEVELAVGGIAQGGDGVGRWQGRAVFAAGALPGEIVRVRLRERQASFARGQVVAVLAPAAERVESPCPLESVCGAADWRSIDYAAQLRYKATILQDQLRHIGGIDVPVMNTWGMASDAPTPPLGPAWGYRTTAELHCAGGRIGYFVPGTRHVADVPECCLHHPLLNTALSALRPLLEPSVPLRGVTLRCSPAQGAVLAVFDATTPLREFARRWMRVCPVLVGIVQRQRGKATPLLGKNHLIQEHDGLRWHVGAGAFFQNNDRQLPRLLERVRALLEPAPGKRFLDLFCGVGTFALPLARDGAHMTGVEIHAPAIADARRSAALNNLESRCTWHAGPVETVLEGIEGPIDGAVLDPPRRGCEPPALDALLRLRPRRLVYVSCHPGTLARDCRRLVDGGYRVTQAEMIDLFPQTHHVESIVTLDAA